MCPVCKGSGELFIDRVAINARRNKRFAKTAVKTQKHFTEHELTQIMDYSNSAATLAKKFGRSIKSIESVRHRLKKKEVNNG